MRHRPSILDGHLDVLVSRKKKAVAPRKGIHIHPRSRIQAGDWVAKIKSCDDVPRYLRAALRASDGLISIPAAGEFRIDFGVIEPSWLDGWMEAFWSDKWELTTASLDITVRKIAGTRTAKWICKMKPDLEVEETKSFDAIVADVSLTEEGQGVGGELKVQLGVTLPAGVTLGSGRMIMAVVDRVWMRFGDSDEDAWQPLTGLPTDSEKVRSWFHEIAVHAGPGYSDTDDNGIHIADDLEARIPGQATLMRIIAEIKKFLQTAK